MRYVSKKFADIIPYESKRAVKGLYLNANESSYNAPKELIDFLSIEVKKTDFNRYPDLDSYELRSALAKKYDADPANFTCGVGSDELIDLILRATVDGDVVLDLNPSFSMYGFFIKISNGIEKKVELNEDFTYSVDNIIQNIETHNPKVVLLCNPNNPTGTWLPNKEIEKIVTSSDCLFIIDEAYGEFAKESATVLGLKYDNVIILKTFSKAMRLAGIRTGYSISSKELATTIMLLKPPFNLNLLSEKAAVFAVNNQHLFTDVIKKTVDERERVFTRISRTYRVYPSEANFLWVELSEKSIDSLGKKAIFLRKFTYKTKTYARITIGTQEENDILLKELGC